jgi:hypothetical protein
LKIFSCLLAILLFLSGCVYDDGDEGFEVKTYPIDSKELTYKKGDCLSFSIDSGRYITGIITDYTKEEGGLWYGICFTNYLDTITPNISTILTSRLCGRKVHSGIAGYYIGIDNEYVTDSCLKTWNKKVKYIGNIPLDTNKIKIAAEGGTDNYSRLIEDYKYNRERRSTPPDDYRAHLWKMNKFRPDEYFPVSYFINK